jgi:hypothetical protein
MKESYYNVFLMVHDEKGGGFDGFFGCATQADGG